MHRMFALRFKKRLQRTVLAVFVQQEWAQRPRNKLNPTGLVLDDPWTKRGVLVKPCQILPWVVLGRILLQEVCLGSVEHYVCHVRMEVMESGQLPVLDISTQHKHFVSQHLADALGCVVLAQCVKRELSVWACLAPQTLEQNTHASCIHIRTDSSCNTSHIRSHISSHIPLHDSPRASSTVPRVPHPTPRTVQGTVPRGCHTTVQGTVPRVLHATPRTVQGAVGV